MNTYILTKIFIYPVKSLGSISLQTSKIEERGLKFDRRWMLVDESNKFITQRSHPLLALISVEIRNNLLVFFHKQNKLPSFSVPTTPYDADEILVQIWNDEVPALKYKREVNDWLTDAIQSKSSLVFMPDSTKRAVNSEYAMNKIVSFADGFPFLMIGEESLKELHTNFDNPLPVNRFRPNFVFSGGNPYDEDDWKRIIIGENIFTSVKPCSRCVITTINQDTGEKGKEPLETLFRTRQKNGKVYFGINLTTETKGIVKVGDKIESTSQ
jgi:uncharacterized protein YcbX